VTWSSKDLRGRDEAPLGLPWAAIESSPPPPAADEVIEMEDRERNQKLNHLLIQRTLPD